MGEPVDRALLEQLDGALAAVADAVPWAERAENRVVWSAGSHSPEQAVPGRAGLAELDCFCQEISAADVGNGWFVHAAGRRSSGPDVPTVAGELGHCTPFGSTGGGDWLVLDHAGAVWLLPPSAIHDGHYRPGPLPISRIADSIRQLLELVLVAARDG